MGLYEVGITVSDDAAANYRNLRADDAAAAKKRATAGKPAKTSKSYRKSDPNAAAILGVSVLAIGGGLLLMKQHRGRR